MCAKKEEYDYKCSEYDAMDGYIWHDKTLNRKKKYRLVQSLLDNDVDKLKKLLNSPKWYQVTDARGNNLLQIALILNHKEVFDYILSLEDFPLEHRNKHLKTAVEIALTSHYDFDLFTVDEYFSLELINKGVKLPPEALYFAVCQNFLKAVKILIESGIDVNGKSHIGNTALHIALDLNSDGIEMESLLLAYNIDTLIQDDDGYTGFELVLDDVKKLELVESTIFYTIDESTALQMQLPVLLRLAHIKSPYFSTVFEKVVEVSFHSFANLHCCRLLLIDKDFLKLLKQKLCFPLIIILLASEQFDYLVPFSINVGTSWESLELVIEDKLSCDFSDYVETLKSNKLFQYLTLTDVDESTVTKVICFLLSHGLKINELDLQMVYVKFGYCEFKILLHMDFQLVYYENYQVTRFSYPRRIMPMFIYDFELTLQDFLYNVDDYSEERVDELLDYFSDPKLVEYCEQFPDEELQVKARNLPQVPKLKQLARDGFRKFLIETYGIDTTSDFYSCVNQLEINNVYKKIITYETKLY